MKKYNTTELPVFHALERGICHRDFYGHAFRWNHVLKNATIGMRVLDVGCGHGGLYEMFYRNKYSPQRFLGLDIRKQTIEGLKEVFPKAEWQVQDVCEDFDYGTDWDIVTSFETAEHIGKQNGKKFLENIKKHCNPKTVVYISTPCYSEKVGAAGNHTFDSGDGRGVAPQEYTYQEFKALIEESGFTILKNYGVFASQTDYKHLLNDWQKQMFEGLKDYYDSNLLSNIIAPFFPEQARNCLWVLQLPVLDHTLTP